MEIKSASFVTSLAQYHENAPINLPQLAVVGKSNVGKSSLINSLCNRKKLCKTSATPGKTRLINVFLINDQFHLVDLPGYGFAKVSQKEKERWGKLMEDYFAANRIDLGVLIVDYRHPPTNNDITMANWFLESGCPFVVVANKMDKLKKSELEPNLKTIRQDLNLPESCPVIPFSAEKGNGRDDLVRLVVNAVKEHHLDPENR